MTELMSTKYFLETVEKFWQVIEQRVELQQGEEVQGVEAGKQREGGGDKVTEIIEQKDTPEEKEKAQPQPRYQGNDHEPQDKAAAKKEEDKKQEGR